MSYLAENYLAYPNYVDRPQRIFKGWNSSRFHEKLWETVVQSQRNSVALSARVIESLSWYPTLVSSIIDTGSFVLPELEQIVALPAVRFRVLVDNYTKNAPLLEAPLFDDAESCERMVRFLRKNEGRFAGLHGEKQFLDRLKLDYSQDPNRYYRALKPNDRNIEFARGKLTEEATQRRAENAAWAFMFISGTSLGAIDGDVSAALLQSEEYAYLAAFVLRKRGLAADRWGHLLEAIQSPRWAFHAVRDLEPGAKISDAERKRLLGIVHASPPWAVELWEAKGWRGETLQTVFSRCVDRSVNHVCAPELHSWYRMAAFGSGLSPQPTLATA